MVPTIKKLLSGALVSGALLAVSGSAHADTLLWVGADNGSWNTASNWFPRAVPGPADSVIIGLKKKVLVPLDTTIANLTVSAGAEIKNTGKIKVTGITTSGGLFTGLGILEVPAGASAYYDINAANLLATVAGTTPAVVFAPIVNKGNITTRVASGCRVDFASIQNTGSTQVLSDGVVTFKDIKNTQNLNINATGSLTLAKIENATGASLSINASSAVGSLVSGLSGLLGNLLQGNVKEALSDPSIVHLDSLVNRVGGTVQLTGSRIGRFFNGTSITNEGDMTISGAQTLLDGDIVNATGATLTLDSDALMFPSTGIAPKLNNSGKIIKAGGSDATLKVDWTNNGQVVVETGILHVCVPTGKGCKQISGTTTLEGGTLSVEDPLGLLPIGTFEVLGGVVDGIGTIQGNVINTAGRLKPGHSPGTITINGNFTQTSGGVLDMELGGTNPGSGYDQILVNGSANLGGTLNISRWNNYVPKDGDVYTLFTYYSKAGTFANFVDKSPVAGISYDTTLTPTDFEVSCYAADSKAPTVTIASPTNTSAARSLTTATGKVVDDSTVTSVTCLLYRYANSVTGVAAGYWNGGTSWTTSATAANEEPVKGTNSWTFTFPTMPAGRYTLRATAKDAAGNTGTSTTISFWVDPNAPATLTVDTPASGSTVTSLPSLGGAVTEAADGSGILSVQAQLRRTADGLYWTGSAWSSTATYLTTTVSNNRWARSAPLPTGNDLKTGSYSITALATDRAGNTKTVSSNFTLGTTASSAPKTSVKSS
ncbi:hypothetical protein EON83_03485 [bacterium]|nr:MAG: hypothetical protein EON83_03485 [bacterium]